MRKPTKKTKNGVKPLKVYKKKTKVLFWDLIEFSSLTSN